MYFKDNVEALGHTPLVELSHLSLHRSQGRFDIKTQAVASLGSGGEVQGVR